MFANSSTPQNSFTGPRVVPIVREAPTLSKEPEYLPESIADNAGPAEDILQAIDFEVAAALCIYGSENGGRRGGVYLVRALERISEHVKALKALQGPSDEIFDLRAKRAI